MLYHIKQKQTRTHWKTTTK